MSRRLLPLIPAGLSVVQVLPASDHVTIVTQPTASRSACPLCDRLSGRIHSRYARSLADLPWQGRVVTIRVQARRFRCVTPDCPRRIFTERLSEVAPPGARRSARLAGIQRHIGLVAGGAAGSRLAARLSMPVSGDTLLRLVRAGEVAPRPPPRVVGIDDWAWRRGQSYGTLVVDLERNRPVDLLPDRDAETVAAWLKAHPGVEVVARDRAGAYADGVRSGAPQAVQVADRWHLLRNLGGALAGVLDRHHRDLCTATAVAAGATVVTETAPELPSPPTIEPPVADRHAVRRARFDEAMALHGQGWPIRRIARALGVNRQTVRGWLLSGQLPAWSQPSRGSAVDVHAEHLRQRWSEGCHNAVQLWQEIQARGFRGQLRTVQRWVSGLRDVDPARPDVTRTTRVWKMLSKRRAAWLVVADPERLDATEQRFVEALIVSSPELGHLIELAREFRAMVRCQQADRLDRWLAAAKGSALAGFADGIARDLAAVRAALSLPWSTSPVEGQISRLKTIKRTMCGRAGFDLLRRRVLEAA